MGTVPDDVIPAWVAEMDHAFDGVTGHPVHGHTPELAEVKVGFAEPHVGAVVDPAWVTPVVDVTAGARVACGRGDRPCPTRHRHNPERLTEIVRRPAYA